MKIYRNNDVFNEGLERIRWLFDEFDYVCVNHSGGKDSTIVYELALMVAREKNKLPLNVMFLDQEGEWDSTIDQIKKVMYNPEVRPIWYQGPFWITNGTSYGEDRLQCWEPGAKWLREKDPISIHENTFGVTQFERLFEQIGESYFGDGTCAMLCGIRAEESPGRKLGLTTRANLAAASYKWITWGYVPWIYYKDKAARDIRSQKPHITFSCIYDWSYKDVWKAIHEHGWEYNDIYNKFYRLGIPVQNMRVSSLFHEQAIRSLFYMQELEPSLHDRLTQRLQGIDSATKFGNADYFPKELPFMFQDWREYRDYLLEMLVVKEDYKATFRRMFAPQERRVEELGDEKLKIHVYQIHVQSILSGGIWGQKISNLNITINNRRRELDRLQKRQDRKERLDLENDNAQTASVN